MPQCLFTSGGNFGKHLLKGRNYFPVHMYSESSVIWTFIIWILNYLEHEIAVHDTDSGVQPQVDKCVRVSYVSC